MYLPILIAAKVPMFIHWGPEGALTKTCVLGKLKPSEEDVSTT